MRNRLLIALALSGFMLTAGCTARTEPTDKGPTAGVVEQPADRSDGKPEQAAPTAGIHQVTIHVPQMTSKLRLT